MFKLVLSGLLVISVSTMLVTETNAIICPTGTRATTFGTCIAFPKGVLLNVVAQGQGCKVDNFFAAKITPLPNNVTFNGLVFCANKPGNIPQGVPVGGFSASDLLTINSIDAIANKQECKEQLILNASQEDLQDLSAFCRQGQVAVDVVPLNFQVNMCITDDPANSQCVNPIDSFTAVCVHPNPANIKFDKAKQMVVGDAFACDRCPGDNCAPCVTNGALNGSCPDL